MARLVPRIAELPAFMRGDKWDGVTINFTKSAHDFTGTTAAITLRQTPDGPVVATLTPSVSYPALGAMQVVFSVVGAVTATFPIGTIFGDVELSRVSAPFGPKTWCRFQVEVIGDMTHG